MKIIKVDASSLLAGDLPFSLSTELRQNADMLVGSHLRELDRHYSSLKMSDPNDHMCLIAIDEHSGDVNAYRYFYFQPGTKNCELFAAYVGTTYRRQGIARQLFLRAIEITREAGCSHFTVRFADPTEERDGLIGYYRRFSEEARPSLKFTFFYRGQELN